MNSVSKFNKGDSVSCVISGYGSIKGFVEKIDSISDFHDSAMSFFYQITNLKEKFIHEDKINYEKLLLIEKIKK